MGVEKSTEHADTEQVDQQGSPQLFSQSLIWDLQREYFEERGVDAWRRGEVPHYVTSNPRVAAAYAELAFACLRDRYRMGWTDGPLYLCELGAGSGRFSYHLLTHLCALCEQAGLPDGTFRYVMTDFAQSNVDFWLGHASLQPYFARGVLDVATFDATCSDTLELQFSGDVIEAGALTQPMVVVANYLFDTIPQELYYFDDAKRYDCLLSLEMPSEASDGDAAQTLASLGFRYSYQEATQAPDDEPALNAVLEQYRAFLDDSHVLFPLAAVRCLRRLRRLSRAGVLLLSADKGEHRLDALYGKSAPTPVCHGSFSLSVNYHALASWCSHNGGRALFTDHRHRSVNIACLLMLDDSEAYLDVCSAYKNSVSRFGPDDFYVITKHVRQHIEGMTVAELLAYVRFSYYDAHQFARYLPRLTALAPELGWRDRSDVRAIADLVWEQYFPLGERLDLAARIGQLLIGLEDFAGALRYFLRSQELYGSDDASADAIELCHQMLALEANVDDLG